MTTPLKIALLAHGTMDIPPKGWGAVESLLWEYYKGLTALENYVSIINTGNNDVIISYLNSHPWDIIHIHDDSLIQLVPYFKHTGPIVFTSHYPAIHDRTVWNDSLSGYNYETMVIAPLLHYMKQTERIVIGALCRKDRDAFLAMGVPDHRIFLMVNGASAKAIQCDDPLPESLINGRTICLGQISERKRQRVLLGIPNVDLWGPPNNESTIIENVAYKGEMTGQMRNAHLCEYENMVLLSTAESSPLAIKEGLFAGLGLVLSEAVASEITEESLKPYITVIPEERIEDKVYLEAALVANKLATRHLKHEIRAAAVALWDWPVLIRKYEATLRSLLSV